MTPGKKTASVMPRKTRRARRALKFWAAAVAPLTPPQITAALQMSAR